MTRHTTFFWIENAQGEIFLEQRPPKGLLGGMMGFPSTGWESAKEGHLYSPPSLSGKVLEHTPFLGEVRHTFTHFYLLGQVAHIKTDKVELTGVWVHPSRFHELALPTLMKKVVRQVVESLR